MSELTSCNYCDLQSIRRRAYRDSKTVETKVVGGWTEVSVDGVWVASFMELPTDCAC